MINKKLMMNMNYYKNVLLFLFLALIPVSVKAQIEVCKYPGCGKFIAKSKNEKGDRFCPYQGKHPVLPRISKPVDLGLPSGTMWAEWNVGASSSEQTGNYYAWGEVESKSYYFWNYFDLRNKSSKSDDNLDFIKYKKNGVTSIVASDHDVAHVKWEGSWFLPTVDQYKELLYYCAVNEEKKKGKVGLRFTGPNGKSIFLPAGGFKYKATMNDPNSYEYWTGELTKSESFGDEYAVALTDIPNKNRNVFDSFFPRLRRHGALVRPVWVDKDKPNACVLMVHGDAFLMSEGFVDGQLKGLLPFRTNNLSKGEHFLVVKKPGHRVFCSLFNIEEGNTKEITVELPSIEEKLFNAGIMHKFGQTYYCKGYVMSEWGKSMIEPSNISELIAYLEKIAADNAPGLSYGFHINKKSISALYPVEYNTKLKNENVIRLDLKCEGLLSQIELEKRRGYNDLSIQSAYMDSEDSLSTYITIDGEGNADFPIIGKCHIVGLDKEQYTLFLKEKYAQYFPKNDGLEITITPFDEYNLSQLNLSLTRFEGKKLKGGFILKCEKE